MTQYQTKLNLQKTVIIGFSVGIDKQADAIRERFNLETKYFSIIYELADYLKEIAITKKPKKMVEEVVGTIKVLKLSEEVPRLDLVI